MANIVVDMTIKGLHSEKKEKEKKLFD